MRAKMCVLRGKGLFLSFKDIFPLKMRGKNLIFERKGTTYGT
jgi:hypothetical protein